MRTLRRRFEKPDRHTWVDRFCGAKGKSLAILVERFANLPGRVYREQFHLSSHGTLLGQFDETRSSLADTQKITGLKDISARTLVHKLVGRGVATRLRPGLFQLVPAELGRTREYLGNAYVVARELMGGKPYYLSHASAMDIHDMVTQPQLVVCVTSPKAMRGLRLL